METPDEKRDPCDTEEDNPAEEKIRLPIIA